MFDTAVLEQMADGIATLKEFGAALTEVRNAARMSLRRIERDSGIPRSTVHGYCTGGHLPSLAQADALGRILAACGVVDQHVVARWMAAYDRVRQAPGPRVSRDQPPYRGLDSFQPEDAPWFFGREELTAQLLARIGGSRAYERLLLVTGASGSGKSSLLRAGLMPAALAQGRLVVLMAPGTEPLTALVGQLCPAPDAAVHDGETFHDRLKRQSAALAALEPPADLLVVVDQLEELFTACLEEDERSAFLAALGALAADRGHGGARIVLCLRADFYAQALLYPLLRASAQHSQIVVGSMSEAELRRAIVEPARLAKLDVEPGLVELLLREAAPAGGGGAYQPGALPLLSHALLTTWQQARGTGLTSANYVASGGIRHSVARSAEAVYEALLPEQQALARRLFLRLVHVAPGIATTRLRAELDELSLQESESPVLAAVLDAFIKARLITVDLDEVGITHEALLSAWPRLREWIEGDRVSLLTRRKLAAAAGDWHEHGRDESHLLRGTQLETLYSWAMEADHEKDLSALMRAFLDRSLAREQAEQRGRQIRARHRKQALAVAMAAVLVLFTMGGYAYQQRQAEGAQTRQAASFEAAALAESTRSLDVTLAGKMSVAAYAIDPTLEARSSLLDSTAAPHALELDGPTDVVQTTAVNPAGTVLLIADADGTARLYSLANRRAPAPIGAPFLRLGKQNPLYAAAFDPTGRLAAVAGADRKIYLFDLSHPAQPILRATLTGPASTVYAVAFSPERGWLAAADADSTIRLWNLSQPDSTDPAVTEQSGHGAVYALAFSANGALLADGCADGTAGVWSIRNPQNPQLAATLTGPTNIVGAVAFSPTAPVLAIGSRDKTVRLWNLDRPADPVAGPVLTRATSWINALAYSPDGHSLAAAGSDDTVRIWNTANDQLTAALPHPSPVACLTWLGNNALITGAGYGTTRLWTLPSPVLAVGATVNAIAYNADGGLLAVGSDRGLSVWDPRTHTLLGSTGPLVSGSVNAVAFDPGSDLVAAGYADGTMQLWSLADPAVPRALDKPLAASASGYVESVAFDKGGGLLVTGGDDGTVRLWNVADPSRPRFLADAPGIGGLIFSVTFSPDGRLLAAGSGDATARLWSVTDPKRPTPLGGPITGPSSYIYTIAFSPDERTLAIASADKTVRLYGLADPSRPVREGPLLTGPIDYIDTLAFSPDDRTLAFAGNDATTWLWNVANPGNPTALATLKGPTGHVYSVYFSPDGRTLAAGGADGSVYLWHIEPADAMAEACADAGGGLDRENWSIYIPTIPYQQTCGS